MKTFTVTPRLDNVVMWLAILALLVVASCMPAFAHDEVETPQAQTTSTLSKQEAKRNFVRNHAVTQSDTISVLVTRVIDGDTFICVTCLTCDDSISVRVLGIDTFEKTAGKHFRRQADEWNYTEKQVKEKAREAAEDARKLLLRQQVKLHRGDKTQDNLDRYYRLLRYVTLPDGSDFTDAMWRKGHDSRR
ncbi:MAG: thermonuclease family protein [Ignavibacteria bacterium]|nr:thermonuclease family protein [Ignavibacteria bacterium]